jgi:hypothetical protein
MSSNSNRKDIISYLILYGKYFSILNSMEAYLTLYLFPRHRFILDYFALYLYYFMVMRWK